MQGNLISWAIAAAAVAVSPVSAQVPTEPAPSESDEIVVKGVRERDREVHRFVDALTDTLPFGQLSKFDAAVCPAAVGLPQAQNDIVAGRMRQIAGAVGIDVAKADCRPNTIVIVVDDPAELIPAMKRKYPAYFTENAGQIPKRPGAATAWHVQGLLDRNGQPVSTRSSSAGGYSTTQGTMTSRLSTNTRPTFLGGVLVVDRQALRGLTVTQLADYAAMRLYARTDPARLVTAAAPSILKVIDAPMDSQVPITMTQWDLSFLKALYATTDNRYATQQRSDMRRRVTKDLNTPAPEDK